MLGFAPPPKKNAERTRLQRKTWFGGTLSSGTLEKAAEKLGGASVICDRERNGDQASGNVLLEPEVFVVSVRLDPLFGALVLGKNLVRSGESAPVSPTRTSPKCDRHVRQHHEGSCLFVLGLLGTVPFRPPRDLYKWYTEGREWVRVRLASH